MNPQTPQTELDIRSHAHATRRCRDCDNYRPIDLDTWGRCPDCAEEMKRLVREMETEAGWDPYP